MTPLATFLWILGVIFLIFVAACLGMWDGYREGWKDGHYAGMQDGIKQECDWWIEADNGCNAERQRIWRQP